MRGLDFPVNIRISNEYFVGYPDVKIPANSTYQLFFGQTKEEVPIIIIKNIDNETVYYYEEDELVKELMYSYWNLCIPYKIIIKNNTESPCELNNKNIQIYITNEE
ncbi:hypothetical protein [Lachnospira sp.]|jgi:hypothetical protein|uniref:hypothetical protein n=1 Tax=Lachnospira sp. TaxID=2049031 RepID=UPI0025803955|nr:hypothetical protein [Lachnospira sp.]